MSESSDNKALKVKSKEEHEQSIYHCVEKALNIYFEDMSGHEPHDLHRLVLSQTEKPLLEVVMRRTEGNVTKSAKMLGINRGTLRKKLKKYDLE